MDSLQQRVRQQVFRNFRDTAQAPETKRIAADLGVSPAEIVDALHALHQQRRLVLNPGTDSIWMAHPFSAKETDFVVCNTDRTWYANCVWDGLSILGIVGDGVLDTHSPQSGAPIRFEVVDGRVTGQGLVHFLVPPRRFWEDIGFT